ncbi:MAG: hypothetical protein ACI9EQ_001197 [Bacteroidia bacterium]|jgi:hypothetical protein
MNYEASHESEGLFLCAISMRSVHGHSLTLPPYEEQRGDCKELAAEVYRRGR